MNNDTLNVAQSGTLYTSSSSLPSPSSIIIKERDEHLYGETKADWNGTGRYLSLIYDESSLSANFLDKLVEGSWPVERRKKASKAFRLALASLVANLLYIRHSNTYSYGYHRMSPNSFLLLRVTYKPFTAAVKGLETHGYIEVEKGFKEHTGRNARSQATRFRATAKLVELAAEYGIDPADWRKCFPRLPRPAAIPDPIVLKAQSTPEGKGRRMNVERDDLAVMPLAAVVNDINAFMQKQDIQPDKHYAFSRFFARGDHPKTYWDQGGRLYSIGLANYQQDNGEKRRAMTINGEAVVELDVKASHLTILHALARVPPRNNPDPYSIIGFDRDAVKTFITMTLGHTEFHRDWTKDAVKGYAKRREKLELPPVDLPSYEDIKVAVLRAMPLLKDWPDSEIRWGDLQFVESQAIVEAVHTLATVHNVVALPVHDSLITPESKEGLARKVLSEAFYKHVGVRPFLDVKPPVL